MFGLHIYFVKDYCECKLLVYIYLLYLFEKCLCYAFNVIIICIMNRCHPCTYYIPMCFPHYDVTVHYEMTVNKELN